MRYVLLVILVSVADSSATAKRFATMAPHLAKMATHAAKPPVVIPRGEGALNFAALQGKLAGVIGGPPKVKVPPLPTVDTQAPLGGVADPVAEAKRKQAIANIRAGIRYPQTGDAPVGGLAAMLMKPRAAQQATDDAMVQTDEVQRPRVNPMAALIKAAGVPEVPAVGEAGVIPDAPPLPPMLNWSALKNAVPVVGEGSIPIPPPLPPMLGGRPGMGNVFAALKNAVPVVGEGVIPIAPPLPSGRGPIVGGPMDLGSIVGGLSALKKGPAVVVGGNKPAGQVPYGLGDAIAARQGKKVDIEEQLRQQREARTTQDEANAAAAMTAGLKPRHSPVGHRMVPGAQLAARRDTKTESPPVAPKPMKPKAVDQAKPDVQQVAVPVVGKTDTDDAVGPVEMRKLEHSWVRRQAMRRRKKNANVEADPAPGHYAPPPPTLLAGETGDEWETDDEPTSPVAPFTMSDFRNAMFGTPTSSRPVVNAERRAQVAAKFANRPAPTSEAAVRANLMGALAALPRPKEEVVSDRDALRAEISRLRNLQAAAETGPDMAVEGPRRNPMADALMNAAALKPAAPVADRPVDATGAETLHQLMARKMAERYVTMNRGESSSDSTSWDDDEEV